MNNKNGNYKPQGKQTCAGKEDELLSINGSAINNGHRVTVN